MAAEARIHVQPAGAALAAAVRALRVAPAQRGFVADPALEFDAARRDPRSEAMAVLLDARVIGFYRLDFSTAVTGRPLGVPSAGVRAFLLDRQVQGHGYGTRAAQALCADARRRHPQLQLLALAVHCCNQPALRAYRNAGFVASGAPAPGGSAGPQQLMLRDLRDMGH